MCCHPSGGVAADLMQWDSHERHTTPGTALTDNWNKLRSRELSLHCTCELPSRELSIHCTCALPSRELSLHCTCELQTRELSLHGTCELPSCELSLHCTCELQTRELSFKVYSFILPRAVQGKTILALFAGSIINYFQKCYWSCLKFNSKLPSSTISYGNGVRDGRSN